MATGVMRDTGDSDSSTASSTRTPSAWPSTAGRSWTRSGPMSSAAGSAGRAIEGSAQDILRLQNSSMHYFQRPDATHVEHRSGGHIALGLGRPRPSSPSRAATCSVAFRRRGAFARIRPQRPRLPALGLGHRQRLLPPRLPVDEAGQDFSVCARRPRRPADLRLRREQDRRGGRGRHPGNVSQFLELQLGDRRLLRDTEQPADTGRSDGRRP